MAFYRIPRFSFMLWELSHNVMGKERERRRERDVGKRWREREIEEEQADLNGNPLSLL